MLLKRILAVSVAAVLMVGCARHAEVVNVYSGRHYQADERLFREFTEQTGIRVNLVKANSDQLLNRLEMEGERSPADIIITADAGRLIIAKEKGLLQSIDSEKATQLVPSHFRDSENFWLGFTKRARVIIYPKGRINPSELDSYESLTGDQWNGRVLVRSSQNHYNQTLMASVLAAHGEKGAENWARGIVNNMARNPIGNDRDQIKGIAAGEGDVAITNTYYIGLMLNSVNREEREVASQMGVFFPNQNDRGTHVNISGIGITANSPNYKNAVLLTEFLLADQAQNVFASENYEYPVNPNVEWPELLKSWGEFKSDTLPLHNLGEFIHQAMITFNNAGWE
ncbi:Fe(3+) ABC transporter substrate-binding protein [Natronoflexus pectinivorans]|uniref:Iron(III) transport system substrate-binding protein n=1 Tax=Natronoflexus pectinivorans TaxID=682526 RepID=A0A4R2G8A7_9BACT|nr:Fe(3+) ABC transporter substrate-binding protein [Natronoflexus pectinivorans]TCO04068.1 iron(III) transport system substrate-binding protein [Natronoflexus pectinivorans]